MIDVMDQANERKLAGERFLLRLKEVWEDHQLCVGMITDVLMYLVRWIFSPFGGDNAN